MCNKILDIVVNWISIITFSFFLLGGLIKGILNLNYIKQSKADLFMSINEEQALELLERVKKSSDERLMVVDIRKIPNSTSHQHFHIKFSERIFDLEIFTANEEQVFSGCLKRTKYEKQETEFDTSIIDPEENLIWSADVHELQSMDKLMWKTATGLKGEFIPEGAAGKKRKLAKNIVYKHTFRSFGYHFFQR